MKSLSTLFALITSVRKLPLRFTLISAMLVLSIASADVTAQQNDDAQQIKKVLRDGTPRPKHQTDNKKSGTDESLKNERNSSFGSSLEGNDVRPIENILREGSERVTLPESPTKRSFDPNAPEIIITVPGNYATIQAAINAANNGDVISVAPGIYRENITLNKFLSIRGANYGINPNTGVRGPESIIQPGTSDPDPNSPTAVTFFYIQPGGSGSTIDGFTFDGDNNLLVSSVNINGANIDAAEAIGAYDGLSNTTVRNNIIKNLNYAGIDFYNFTNGGASTYDNSVTANLFDNIIPTQFGIAVLIYNNCYTGITNNVMTRVRIGIQTGNFYNTDLGTNHNISNNEIESYRLGIFHNLAYTNATAYTISGNLITTVAGAPNNHGILVSSIESNVGASITDNDVTDARVGVNFWNCPTTNTITVTGGTYTDCNIGIFPNNYDGYTSDAATSSYAITGVTLTNCDTAIWVRDNNLNSNSATVTLNINNTTNVVNGTGIGLLIEGGDASVIFNGSVPVDFSTTHSKYIRLITNGSGYPTSDINALGVQFGGTAGAGLSDAQLFAVEDKIDHKMDFGTLGFVRVKNDNSYITVNSFYLPETFDASIQNGIDITPAADTLSAASGVYREDITLNKQLTIKGTNFGINPNTGVRVAESIIQPGSSDPDPNSPTALTYFYIEPGGSGSTIDGFTFDGDNTTITSSVNINGANIDAAEAIGAYEGLSDLKLTNNIVKNLNYTGIDFYNYYNSGAATTGNIVSENLFDNIIPNVYGIAVLIYNNCYTDITDNVMTRVRIGIQTGNFFNADPGTSHDISNNEVESSRLGIFHNLTYTNASSFNITSNNFTTVTGATNNHGMLFSSIGSAVGAVITDNDVSDARVGCNFWNCTTSNTITVTGGNITNCNVGVFPNNYDGYTSDAATGTSAITGVTITNCDTSIWIRDNNLNTNNATITLNINNATNVVNGTGIGLLIEGSDAFVNFNGAIPVDFSSTHSKYIRLTTNGSSYPNTNINAQSVRFGGLTGAGMSNVQLFDVEDKIDHKIDFNSLGFVSVKPNNSYVTTNSFYLPNTSVPSIQNAVNIAPPSSSVNLDSGTFNENVTVGNSISLIGSGTGGTILTPSVSCTGDGLTITASNVNVSNLTLSNYVYGIRTSSSNTSLYNVESILNCQYGINVGNGTSNLSMIKCKFNNNTVGGWRSGTAEMATKIFMDSCEVKRNGVGASNGFGIFVAATTPAANVYDSVIIKNSDFRGNLKKGMYFEKLRNALIENVNLDSNGTDATYGFNNGIDMNLKYDSYSNISIINCIITNCGFNGTSVDPNNPAAVTIKARDDAPSYSADPATLTGVVFNNNFVSGPVNGLRFGEFNKTNNSPTGVTTIENSFGNGYSNKAIVNKTANTITVSCNWYGTTIPTAVVALHSSGLNFLPYLVNGTDNDLGAAGFQIVPGSCTGIGPVTNITQNTNYIAIQPAIDAANPGDVIEASAGTYNEKVIITKSLTLQGINRTTVIVDGTGFVAPAKGITINNGITNVTIQNLTVQNFAGSGGNSDAGIYGIGGNNNLTVNNVTIQNNSNGSGFYMNGPVNTVLLDSVTASGHTVGARGIVIWNGLKENITITNCEVFGNNCCGIELQDGTASGVTISNNYIHDNGDNGIGIVGLQGPGENLISNNTLVNNGRFGIEIKNPNGSGLTTGPGRVVVENNNVSRTLPIADLRDIVGIAAFRRGVLPGNVDVPNGAVIQNNTVSGYVQPSTSDGFGIVVEGTNHTVSGNTVTGCDVGIQRQAGHLPYPGEGDQSNLADAYFGRGNSPITCGVTIGPNTLTNTINTRDVGAVAGGIVTNINTSEIFCSIQSAINDAQTLNGHTITVPSGSYNEQVLVTKSVTIKGIGATKPVLDFTGTVSGKPTLFDVSVRDVTIENMKLRVDQTKLSSAIIASGTDIDNITVKSDSIEAYASSAAGAFGLYGNRNAISINYGGPTNYRVAAGGVDNINVDSNTVSGVVNDGFGNPRYFRAAVAVDEGGGSFTNNTMQSINHDVLVRFGSNGNINITNNNLIGGGVELSDMNAGAGTLTVANNIFDATFANSSAPGAAVLRVKNNYYSKTTLVNSNTFSNHQWAMSLENYNTVTVDNNTFTPLASSTVFHHIAVNTKSISGNSNSIVQVTTSATLTNNTFNYSGIVGGTALSFHNHDNDAAVIGTITVGSPGNENDFNSGIANFVYLDNQTGASNLATFPAYTALIGASPGAITTMACWATNINIESNMFDVGSGLQLPSAMNFSQRNLLEAALFHKPDNSCLGNLTFFKPVHNLTQNTFFETIQSAINSANVNDVIECDQYTYNEKVTIDKSLTLQGVNRTTVIVDGTGFAAPAKGITINNGITNVTIQNLTVQNFAGSGGNSDAGIYGIGGNNNLTVNNVTIQNNSNGSGFYANGPVNTVLLDSVTASGHTVGARGIVIWNGLKENITITNCEVFGNNCCGIELQDGTASGVTVSNNYIHDNGDNGIGIVGLQGPGENLISNNTLVNNGRFGIEIKNPNGSGLTTGPGRVVVENNNVSRTVPIIDARDIVGIAAFRRGVLPGNVDVPNGAVIQNNTVSGYTQPSTSDGFGIVVEGTSHTVSGNTVTGCDVGIQRQAGHLPYPGDGDQSDLADTYFGRGNSPATCGVTISGNTLTNTINTRDVGASVGGGLVQNTNTSEIFCSIQAAIDDAQTLNGHNITIAAGTYTENVNLSKRLTLDGAGSGSDPTTSSIIQSVTANTPVIQITSSGADATNRVVVKDLRVTGATGSSNTGAGLLVQSSVASGYYTFENVVSRSNQGAGLVFNSTVSVTDVAITNSVLSMNGNDGLRIASAVPSFNNLNVTGCQIDSNSTSGFNYNPSGTVTNAGTNFSFTNTNFTNNSTANVTNAHDLSFFKFYGNATLTNVNVTSNQLPTKAHGIAFTGNNNASGTIQLNGVTCSGNVGKGALLFQLYNDINNISLNNVDVQSTTAPWGQVIIDHTDADAFSLGNTTLRTLVLWNVGGVNATAANFRHITLGTPLSTAVLADNFQIEDQVVHKVDLLPIGLARVKAGEIFVTVNSFVTPNTTPSIQRGVDAATAGDLVHVGPGTFNERVIVNKLNLTVQGVGPTSVVTTTTAPAGGVTPSIFKVVSTGVSIKDFQLLVDFAYNHSGIHTSGTCTGLSVSGNTIISSGTAAYSYGLRNAIAVNPNITVTGYTLDNVGYSGVSVSGNTIQGTGTTYFRAGIQMDLCGGSITGNTSTAINHDFVTRFANNGAITVSNNFFYGGGAQFGSFNAGAGTVTVSNNLFDNSIMQPPTGNIGTGASLRMIYYAEVPSASNNVIVSNNTFQNHRWAVSVENFKNITFDNNTFTPKAGSTDFIHMTFNTKIIASTSADVGLIMNAVGATLTKNTFNGSGSGGTAMAFYNHRSTGALFGTYTLGTASNENTFNAGIASFIRLDNSTGPSSGWVGFGEYTGIPSTTMACWGVDINIENNKFDVGSGLQLPSAMNFTQRTNLEAALFHKPDNSCLGSLTYFLPVHNLTQNTFYQTIQSAINVANVNDVIECEEYTFNEKVTIDRSLTLQGISRANTKIDGTGFASPAKGITINSGITNVTIKKLTVQNFAGAGGNSDGGIYAIGGNNNLTVKNVTIQNNSNGSGFYANGPVNTVLIDSVTASGHTVGARGIVIWNGLKENITITNSEVFGNNCCGIELQDGTASGVTVSNNYIHDNGDNGIGIVGLQGPGENLISGNTIVNNGRFGIEIKNPNGSGLTTGPGRVVVENNNVSRTVPIVDARDIAGIAAFRRGVLPGNVDVPNGTVIQNNTVSGYAQPSTSDGFGIVVEGTNHTVSGNTVTGCDVGIQRQAGHLPYPGDGDQNNLADSYFGRGNSPITCAITISGNILTNTLNTRDVGASTGSGIVMNINTNEMFCSIQAAIDDPQTLNGHVLDIDSATYTESVVVNKQVTLKGNGGRPNGRPTVAGVAGQAISVTVPNVTIDNIIVKFDQVAVNTGIRAATSGTFNNLTVKNSCIFGTGNTGLPIFASFGLQLGSTGGVQYDQVNLDSNEIKHIGTSWIGRGVRTLNCFGDWKNSKIDGYYAFQSGDNQGGILNITGNETKGTNELNYFGAGAHSFNNNVCKPASAFGGGTDFAMLELKNVSLPASSLNITGNSFQDYVNFGIFSGRSNNITIDNNTFIPEPSAVNFRSIRIDTKQRTLPVQPAFASGAVITNNTFFGSIAPGENGISVELANSDNVSSIGTVVIGTPGNGNIFNTNTKKFISLNNETLSTAGDPIWTSTYVSTKAKVTANVTAVDNQYDAGAGVQFPTAMNLNTLFTLENLIQHTIDDGGLGFVTVKANNTFVTINSFVAPATTTASVQRGINPASSGFTVNVNSGTYTGAINVNKGVKLLGLNSAISPNTGIRNPEAKLTTASGIMMNVTTTEPVDIKGFEVANAGGAFDYSITGAVDANVRLEKNFFNNSIGLYFPNSDTFNVIDNRCTFSSGADEGMALFGDYNGSTGTYSDIHDNVFLNGQMTGFNLSNINGKVYKNTFSNIAYYAILVANLCNLDIYENNFLNISNPDTTVTTWGAGIRFYDDANGAIVSVHNNLFSGNYNGVTVRTAYDFTGVTVNVSDNSISGSTRWNIRNEGTGALPATCNWLGSASNDTISQKLSGTINYTPWLVTGVDNDLGTAGFQPVPGSCTGQPIIAGTLNLKIKLEASTCADTVIVHMRNGTTPFALVSADTAVMDTAGNVVLNFPTVVNGTNYYIAVFHRNSMETWSATTQVFTLGTLTYDFTTGVNKAYGNNMKLISGTARIYAGDVNQDDIVDGTDVLMIDNDAANFVFGYTDTDLNCDGAVDGTDLLIADNNAFAVVIVSRP